MSFHHCGRRIVLFILVQCSAFKMLYKNGYKFESNEVRTLELMNIGNLPSNLCLQRAHCLDPQSPRRQAALARLTQGQEMVAAKGHVECLLQLVP